MSKTAYLAAAEFDMAGLVGRVHAVICYEGQPWVGTVCGLPNQPYPPAGSEWDAVPADVRCGRCVAALD
jgi:hypothetical protein